MATIKPPAIFKRAVELMTPKLMDDFGFDRLDCAAIMGNGGHESSGGRKMQETRPTVEGSLGGYGFWQWTGMTHKNPRRKNFEKLLAKRKTDVNDLEANYAMLFLELRGPEKKAVAAVKRAGTLEEKVVAFEQAYERAGVKHYPSRQDWARAALKIIDAMGEIKKPEPVKPALVTPSAPPATGFWGKLKAAFGRKDVPVIEETKGDPVVYGVQKQLKAKGYYLTGDVDGIDGRKTRDAVASIRKDNGMGDGGMDDEFMRRLPGLPQAPVSPERAGSGLANAAAKRPAEFAAPKALTIGGFTITGLSGIIGLGGGAIQKAQETAEKAGAAIDTAQGILEPILAVIGWMVRHPFIVIGAFGVWMILRGVLAVLDRYLAYRQGRI